MAFTKVVGAGIHTLSNITSHNINSSGIITATKFVGPMENGSGISTFYDLRVTNNLTVDGTTTTLDTKLVEVDKIEVEADSTNVAIAVTQTGSGDLIRLYDGGTNVLTVTDTGDVGIGSVIPQAKLDVTAGGVNNAVFLKTTSDKSLIEFENSAGSTYNTRIGSMTIGSGNVGLCLKLDLLLVDYKRWLLIDMVKLVSIALLQEKS